VQTLAADPGVRFDHYCWDLYARVSLWYEENKDNLKLRLQTLHDIEQGGNEPAEIARLISNALFAGGIAAVVLVLLGGTTWLSGGFWAPDGVYSRFVSPATGLVAAWS